MEPANGSGANGAAPAGPRSPQQIEAEIERARANLAVTLDELVDRVKPANVAKRTADQIRAQFVDPDTGAPRMDRIAPVVGGVAGVLALVIVVKRRGKRKK
ncbi:MAG: DUF3618 domain-containing protein [Streptomycetaceae bacterium]|nr:DUF3618 domain-containing protein [Streptomycetaceae bacterium]NUS54902.1 DUF3618 domain-containing protein [Streptomycetaceae bacterium]